MRLIDADALVADTQFFDGHEWHYGYTEDEIKEAPTIDAVPVVRCGECKHLSEFGFCMNPTNSIFPLSERRADWFCADGERRES